MTNSIGGLKRRLRQFDNTICGKGNNHSDAKRVRDKYKGYDKLKKYLYVAVHPLNVMLIQTKKIIYVLWAKLLNM